MAEIMMRIKSMRPRAERLLNAILPHAVALETIELERDILALLQVIKAEQEQDSAWKVFIHNVTTMAKSRFKKADKEKTQPPHSES